MRKLLLLLLLGLSIPMDLWAQSDEWVVLTFSSKRRSYDKTYIDRIWIVPYDSIKLPPYAIYPLVIDDEGSDLGLKYDPCYLYMQIRWDTMILYPDYYKTSPGLAVIKEGRKLIQTFEWEWPNSNRGIKTRVYATPIRGTFKTMNSNKWGKTTPAFFYYTTGQIEPWKYFWETDKAEILQYSDFSRINYGYDSEVREVDN